MQTFSFCALIGGIILILQQDTPMKRTRSRKGAPGIVEVARRAGVAPATVSRYFNSPKMVKIATRNRIEKAASDLGYIRDRMAGTLHNRFSGTIGLVVPTIDNAIFAELIEAFATKLREHDRTLLIAAHGYDLSLEVDIIRSLLERRIDGIALIGFDHEKAPIEMLAIRNVPTVAIWNYRDDCSLDCIGANNFDAGYRVTKYLIERGHRDIALLFPPTSSNDRAHDRLRGSLTALEKSATDISKHRMLEAPYDIGAAKQVVKNLLETNPPSALVCGNDIIAQGAIYACQNVNIKVPEDISIIGIGDFRGSAFMEPALTTLRMPARRIGNDSAEALCLELIGNRGKERKRVLVPTKIMERASVRDIRK